MDSFINSFRFNFLYADQYTFGKKWSYSESIVPYNMLRYIIEGQAVFVINGEEILVEKGGIFYVPERCKLSCRALSDKFSFISIRFTTSVHYQGEDFLAEYYGIPRITKCEDEDEYFYQIYKCVHSKNIGRMFRVRGYLDLLIGSLISRTPKQNIDKEKLLKNDKLEFATIRERVQNDSNKIDSRIQLVIDYMVLNPYEEYTIQRLCEMAELSNSRFRTLFKKQIGKTPSEYVRDLKVTAAARKLLISNDNVSDIGYSVGFEDPNYFIRVFKKSFGLTPRQYRETAKG